MVLSNASSGLGHSNRESIDSITLDIVRAGLQQSLRISKHKDP